MMTYRLQLTNAYLVRCGHPHSDPGSHPPPPPEYNLTLQEQDTWDVSFNSSVRYVCEEGTWIENDTLRHPNDTHMDVECLHIVGTYNIPEVWPNCTHTVNCGHPPQPTVNGSR